MASLSVHVENNPVQAEPVAHKSHQDMDCLVTGGGFLKHLQGHGRSGLVIQAALLPAFCLPGLFQIIIGNAAILLVLHRFVEKDSSLSGFLNLQKGLICLYNDIGKVPLSLTSQANAHTAADPLFFAARIRQYSAYLLLNGSARRRRVFPVGIL